MLMYLLFKRIKLAAVCCSVFPARFQRNLQCGVVVFSGQYRLSGTVHDLMVLQYASWG